MLSLWYLLFFSNLQKSCKNSTENFPLALHLGVCSQHRAPSLPNILECTSYLSRIFSLDHSIAIKHMELTLIHHYHIIYRLHSSFTRIIQYPGCIWWPHLFSCFPSGIIHQVFLLWHCCFWRLLLLFNCYDVPNSLKSHGLQHASVRCPSLSPGVWSASYPLSWWCYLTISPSAFPFSFCLQSLPASESFLTSQLFTFRSS